MVSILFVCLGNICRSPAAEAMLNHYMKKAPSKLELHVESCGLGDWHIGKLPDERMREAAKNRGIVLSSRAKKIEPAHLDQFDYVLVADQKVMREVYTYAVKPEHKAKIHMITHFSTTYCDQEIPDPYWSGEEGFELVLDMIEDSCEGLISHLKSQQ